MKRSFMTTLVGAAALVALAATGCNKEEKKDPTAPGAGGGGAPATGAPAAGGGMAAAAPAVPAGTGFSVFPATSKVVGGINVAGARSSAIWNMYKDQIQAAMSKEMAEFQAMCGFDPLATIQSAVIGGDPTSEEFVLVVKGVGREQAKTCGEKVAVKEGKKLSITDEGNLTLYEADGEKVWAA